MAWLFTVHSCYAHPARLDDRFIVRDIHVAGSPSWLRAKTATGSITFQGASSDVGLSTVSGPIKVDGGIFERAKLETVTGDITFGGKLEYAF